MARDVRVSWRTNIVSRASPEARFAEWGLLPSAELAVDWATGRTSLLRATVRAGMRVETDAASGDLWIAGQRRVWVLDAA